MSNSIGMSKKKILFMIGLLGMNGATKSLIALLNAIADDYDISLFLFNHDTPFLAAIPRNVSILPESPYYKIWCTPLRQAIKQTLRKFRFDLLIFRLRVAWQRYRKKPFALWDKMPEITGEWDDVCVYCDGNVAEFAIRKVPKGKKALWIHCDYTQFKQSKQIFEAFKKADVAVSVSLDSIEKFKIACGESISTPFAVVHNIIDIDDVRRRAKAYSVPPPMGGGG